MHHNSDNLKGGLTGDGLGMNLNFPHFLPLLSFLPRSGLSFRCQLFLFFLKSSCSLVVPVPAVTRFSFRLLLTLTMTKTFQALEMWLNYNVPKQCNAFHIKRTQNLQFCIVRFDMSIFFLLSKALRSFPLINCEV